MPTVDAQVQLYVQARFGGATTQHGRTPGLRGRWNALGNRVFPVLFPDSSSLNTPKKTQSYLRGQGGGSVTGPSLLTLDYVKHAHPFAWARTGDPSLLTLDWAKHAVPFATNDGVSASATRMKLRVIASFGGKFHKTTPTFGPIVSADKTTLAIRASCSATMKTGYVLTFVVQADQPTRPSIHKRNPKPCEIPSGVPHVTSNIPYDVWQEHPYATFDWTIVYACAREQAIQVPADGYYWTLSKTPEPVGKYTWNFTTGNHAEADLSLVPPYGTGRWYFNVCAYTSAGLGPVGRYIVCYDHVPQMQQPFFMRIDGLDTLQAVPFVKRRPGSPHILTWPAFLDADPADVVNYDVEIGKVYDFSVDRYTQKSPVEATLANLPTPTGTLTQILTAGRKYWRIRAFDGSLHSEWSPVGSFDVNALPDKPDDLEVRSILRMAATLFVQASASGIIRKLP